DVVAQAELERETHLLQLSERLADDRLDRLVVLAGLAYLDDGHLGRRSSLARKSPPAKIAQAAPDSLRGLDVDHQQRLLEARGGGEHAASLVEHERVSVEDELVLAADGVAEGDEARVVPRAGSEHLLPLAVAAEVERRRRNVRDQLRSGEREVRRRRAGLPQVLADRR